MVLISTEHVWKKRNKSKENRFAEMLEVKMLIAFILILVSTLTASDLQVTVQLPVAMKRVYIFKICQP